MNEQKFRLPDGTEVTVYDTKGCDLSPDQIVDLVRRSLTVSGNSSVGDVVGHVYPMTDSQSIADILKSAAVGSSNELFESTKTHVRYSRRTSADDNYTLDYNRVTGVLRITENFVADPADKQFLDDAIANGRQSVSVRVPHSTQIIKLGKLTGVEYISPS